MGWTPPAHTPWNDSSVWYAANSTGIQRGRRRNYMRIPKYFWFHLVPLATAWLPDLKPLLRMRGFFLRPCFKACGANLQVARRVTINFSNRMEIGCDVYIATGCWIHAWGGAVLEDEVQLGPYSVLVTGDHSLKVGSYRYGPRALPPICICH